MGFLNIFNIFDKSFKIITIRLVNYMSDYLNYIYYASKNFLKISFVKKIHKFLENASAIQISLFINQNLLLFQTLKINFVIKG